MLRYGKKPLLRFSKKQLLQKQVSACISGDTQLRKNDDLCPVPGRLLYSKNDLLCIIYRIRYSDLRRHCRRFYKSMFHDGKPYLSMI